MFAEIWPLISVVLGIVILLSLIIFLKLNTFISLIITSIVTALLFKIDFEKLVMLLEGNGAIIR